RVIDGQDRELSLKCAERPTLPDYFAMVEGKTSGLFCLPMAGGALLCGATEEVVQTLEQAAVQLGVLFQIQDDVLDLYGDKGRARAGCDIAEGKRSMLVVHALSCCSAAEAAWLRQVLDVPREETSDADIEDVRTLFARTGVLPAALAEIRARRRRAVEAATRPRQPELVMLVEGLATLLTRPLDGCMPRRMGWTPAS
ncbi:MAG: polyprenyl synthetase family protein, partial [Deltaproteobacteria bacterium]|nr:polyprenyl synthetase family protein [Deltaproteobacteria bacterium]